MSQLFSWVLGSPEFCVPAPTFSLIYVVRYAVRFSFSFPDRISISRSWCLVLQSALPNVLLFDCAPEPFCLRISNRAVGFSCSSFSSLGSAYLCVFPLLFGHFHFDIFFCGKQTGLGDSSVPPDGAGIMFLRCRHLSFHEENRDLWSLHLFPR